LKRARHLHRLWGATPSVVGITFGGWSAPTVPVDGWYELDFERMPQAIIVVDVTNKKSRDGGVFLITFLRNIRMADFRAVAACRRQ
jgi:hypothetical protein